MTSTIARLLHSDTTSDFLIKRITEWGIRRIYGYPGDGINGIMGALDRTRTNPVHPDAP